MSADLRDAAAYIRRFLHKAGVDPDNVTIVLRGHSDEAVARMEMGAAREMGALLLPGADAFITTPGNALELAGMKIRFSNLDRR